MILAGLLASGRAEGAGPADREDVHSFARPDQVRVTRVQLDLDVDFAQKVLHGTATLTVARTSGAPADAPLVLDTKGLVIERVTAEAGGQGRALTFTVGPEDAIKGRPLTIDLDGADAVRVAYRTTPRASAVQWLDKEGTAGKEHPFLFTQSEAIHARSWIPLQDSPAVRVTYGATVRVPEGLTAVMSADRLGSETAKGTSTFRFEMPQPVAPYLIALAVGDLEFRPIGARTGVFAEPTVVEKAAKEFADTEKMVEAVEKRFGPYRWGRYDLLVLPPSFPFGGMENPKLTFATPTVLAGDRSLVSLVAHELAHSWSGNLVTNATWRDFWLNEGFTTYLERRVVEDLYGPGRADMERVLGWGELRREMATLPPRDQVLHIDLAGRDPDEGMNQVPYEKGALFLSTVERAVGRDRFDAYLRGYFDRFAFKSITTADFVADLRARLLDGAGPAAKSLDLHAWLDEPGLPKDAPEPKSDRFARVEAAARDWAAGKTAATALPTADWSTQEWVHFLRSLPDRLPAERMAELDRAFGLTDRGNSEVAHQWLILAVRNHYTSADARLESFLTTIGRRKFLVPLYSELVKTPGGRDRARAIYARARPFYHPIARESVDKLLGGTQG
jgi:aminopeptidase N